MKTVTFPVQPDTSQSEVGEFLFAAGYSAERLDDDTAMVREPSGARFLVDRVRHTCTCQKATSVPCMHVLGCAGLLSEQDAFDAAMIAQLEAECEAWAVIESDRTDRLLREIGAFRF